MAFSITGAKYAVKTLSAVGTTTVTIGSATFVSTDFGATQRMVALWSSANVFKGIAWVRQYTSTTTLQLENQFVDPVTGLFATQVVGDQILVSKNFAESAVTGLAVNTTNRIANVTDLLQFGTAGSALSVCFYDEDYKVTQTDALTTLGGVAVLGKLISYDGLTRESFVWSRECILAPLSTFIGSGAGSLNYSVFKPANYAADFFMFGGSIGGSYQSSNFIGIVGTGTGNHSFAFFGTRLNYCLSSQSNGGTWGTYASRHLAYNCTFEATYTNADLVMIGDGSLVGGSFSFPQNASGTLGIFRGIGSFAASAPAGKRLLVSDLGAGAFIDGIASGTTNYTFTNVITPAVTTSRTGTSGSSTCNVAFNFADTYSNLKSGTTIAIKNNSTAAVVSSVVNTASTTFTGNIPQATYTATTVGAMTQVTNYTSFSDTIKAYGYLPLSSTYTVANYSLGTGGTGKNLSYGGIVNQQTDAGVTLSQTAALALSSKFAVNSSTKTVTVSASATLDELYDYTVAWGCSSAANATVPSLAQYVFTYAGSTLSATTGWTLVVNSGVTVSAGAKFSTVYVPTITNNGSITALYSTTAGTSGVITLTTPVGSSLLVTDNNGATTYIASSTGTNVFTVTPGQTGAYTFKVGKRGFKPQTSTETITGGGVFTDSFTLLPDTDVVNTTTDYLGTPTLLSTAQTIYDALAQYAVTNAGMAVDFTGVSKSFGAIDFGALNVVQAGVASNTFTYSAGTLTIYSVSLASDTYYSTGNFTQTGSPNLNSAVKIRFANLNSEIIFTVDSVATYPTMTDRDNNTNPGLVLTGSVYRYLYGATINGVVFATTLYSRVTQGTTTVLASIPLATGTSNYTLDTAAGILALNSEVTAIATNLNTINLNVIDASILVPANRTVS